MKRNYLTFKVPNDLICNTQLDLTTRQIGSVLYGHRNAFGFCKKSVEDIAALAGRDPKTVRKALMELQEAGYIDAAQTYRWSKKHHRLIYGKKSYRCNLSFAKGFTLIPRALLKNTDLTPAAFCMTLYLVYEAGNNTRAFPDIDEIVAGIGVAHSTVCRCLQRVKQLAQFLVRLCLKKCGKYAKNSYHLVANMDEVHSVAPAADLPQATASTVSRKIWTVRQTIHTNIVNLIRRCCKLFSWSGVVPFFPNYSYDLDNDRVYLLKRRNNVLPKRGR